MYCQLNASVNARFVMSTGREKPCLNVLSGQRHRIFQYQQTHNNEELFHQFFKRSNKQSGRMVLVMVT